MEWLNSMSNFGQEQPQGDEGMEYEEDFYGNATNGTDTPTNNNTLPGAAQDGPAQTPGLGVPPVYGQKVNSNTGASNTVSNPASLTPVIDPQRKLENQRKADELRAKLLANRNNTPNRSNTPSKPAPKQETPLKQVVPPTEKSAKKEEEFNNVQNNKSANVLAALDSFLDENRAVADAKNKEEAQNNINSRPAADQQPSRVAEAEQAVVKQQQNIKQTPVTQNHDQPNASLKLTDPYYADLSIWLEVTGYHDTTYRDNRLRTYKERKSLEEEAARIQARLKALLQTEQAENEAMRTSSMHPTPMPNPSLRTVTQDTDTSNSADKKPITNGLKRVRSPEPMPAERNARRREDSGPGLRIRGANDSPENRSSNTFRGRAASPPADGLERRISYPDSRRRNSFGETRGRQSRDPSLERRQSYYRGEGGPPPRDRDRFEYYPPRDNVGRGRGGFNDRDLYQGRGRGSQVLDLRKGDVRYFMIKSWNAENVTTAMRDSLWATQEKNSSLLADAFYDSRHVILLFSVNKSTQFQGYALMTSPPDPLQPKPSFCARLNWPTSAAFTLRWLAQTSVHFRHVGHLKNEMNMGEDGAPMAVLVGKDGQEISPAAGLGLCAILDAAEEEEGGGRW